MKRTCLEGETPLKLRRLCVDEDSTFFFKPLGMCLAPGTLVTWYMLVGVCVFDLFKMACIVAAPWPAFGFCIAVSLASRCMWTFWGGCVKAKFFFWFSCWVLWKSKF